jgi:hypothetical protein
MAKQLAPIRVICFCLLAACQVLCQSERPTIDSLQRLQFDGPNSPEVQRQEMPTWSSLPDAPSSAQPPTKAERSHIFVHGGSSHLRLALVGVTAGALRETGVGDVTAGLPLSSMLSYQLVFARRESSTFLNKNVYSPLLKRNPRYRPSTSSSFVGRVSYAASRILITRDDSGKERLNTSYFLGVLASVAIHTANRPYWAQSASRSFNNFGSTIGSDAGSNLFREFRPGILRVVKGHAPNFVFGIGQGHQPQQVSRDVVSTPAR